MALSNRTERDEILQNVYTGPPTRTKVSLYGQHGNIAFLLKITF